MVEVMGFDSRRPIIDTLDYLDAILPETLRPSAGTAEKVYGSECVFIAVHNDLLVLGMAEVRVVIGLFIHNVYNVSMNSSYDQSDPQSILAYAKKLVGKSLKSAVGDKLRVKRKGKGGVGQDVESCYFGIKNSNAAEPDFKEAGVELKTFPLKKNKEGGYVAKERISLGMIDYHDLVNEKWETSALLNKNSLLLLIAYLYEREIIDPWDYVFKVAALWRFPETDLKIIKDDWLRIQSKVRSGKAHELSEGDTLYLGAVTKSSDSTKRRKQPYGTVTAKPRAFSLKQNYVNIVLTKIFGVESAKTMSAVITDLKSYSGGESFEELVIRRFQPYVGLTLDSLTQRFNVNPRAKNFAAIVTNRILGVKTRKVEEFEKAGITVKTIRLNRNGKPEEAMSFPFFHFKEIIKEEWESSTLREMLSGRFFFVIYKKDERGNYRLHKVKFWSMPITDLEGSVRGVWENTRRCIINGLLDGFTKTSDDMVAHIRPHGRNAADVDELPSGKKTTKRCFWINLHYLKEQI